MSVLKNAAMSIQVGLEDLAAGTPERLLSSVRNLHAGVLLLMKARLLDLSPEGSDEVLIKQSVLPRRNESGELAFVGAGKKTVDIHEIKERFRPLGVVIDWTRIDRLTSERNNIEHYYARVSNDALRGLATDVLIVVRDFAIQELRREPRELLGDQAWDALLKHKEVYDAERAECLLLLRQVEYTSRVLASALEVYSCPRCASQLVQPDDPTTSVEDLAVRCRSCGDMTEGGAFVEQALRQLCPHDSQREFQDGALDPLGECPDCCQDTFVIAEDACARCGYERPYARCIQCEKELDLDEQWLEGMCSGCEHFAS